MIKNVIKLIVNSMLTIVMFIPFMFVCAIYLLPKNSRKNIEIIIDIPFYGTYLKRKGTNEFIKQEKLKTTII